MLLSRLVQAVGVGVHGVGLSPVFNQPSMMMRHPRESLLPCAITFTSTAGWVVVVSYDHGRVRCRPARLSIDIQIVDRRHCARRAEHLEDDVLRVERNNFIRKGAASRRVVIGAEDAVQAVHGKARDCHHHNGDQQHPPSR